MESPQSPDIHRHFSIRPVIDEEMASPTAPGTLPPYNGYSDDKTGSVTATSPLHVESGLGVNATYTNFRSLRRMTREALPRLDNYRNLASLGQVGTGQQRPTIDDLLNPSMEKQQNLGEDQDITENLDSKFGWIKGVVVRVLLNIWGVILFIRLSWVGGQSGILEGIGVIMCGTVVTVITTLSMSAISTNGQMKGGGTYFMISRSLGAEVGGAIGLMFAFANACAASMHIVGFCESLNDLLASLNTKIFDGGLNDIRLNACITILVLIAIVRIGLEWEARAQVFLLLVLIVAMGDFVIGAFMGPMDDEELAKGFVGMNTTVFYNNLLSDYRQDKVSGAQMTFFNVFAVFFPACTGILAGANISGDLKVRH
ncbi:hypothetical protein SK128_015902 [Halocaridina rubra]|uniref:Amino acid permease/ SLC12A domain-containing protein n=1 Tax=Halocaridina rubra TaxID=373956 RepID=A0AAN8WX94_HALRR